MAIDVPSSDYLKSLKYSKESEYESVPLKTDNILYLFPFYYHFSNTGIRKLAQCREDC